MKVFLWFFVLFVVILIVGFTIRFFSLGLKESLFITDEIATSTVEAREYFREELIRRASATGLPVEGFDAPMLLLAFPMLREEDFNDVETLGGRYEYRQNALQYGRHLSRSVSSGERSLSSEGYDALLQNLSTRFGIKIIDRGSVDMLLGEIGTPDPSTHTKNEGIALNETVSMGNVSVTPVAILEDSRCALEVECTHEGTIRVETRVEDSYGESTQVFTLNESFSTESITITLIDVTPLRSMNAPFVASDYRFTFRFEGENTGK